MSGEGPTHDEVIRLASLAAAARRTGARREEDAIERLIDRILERDEWIAFRTERGYVLGPPGTRPRHDGQFAAPGEMLVIDLEAARATWEEGNAVAEEEVEALPARQTDLAFVDGAEDDLEAPGLALARSGGATDDSPRVLVEAALRAVDAGAPESRHARLAEAMTLLDLPNVGHAPWNDGNFEAERSRDAAAWVRAFSPLLEAAEREGATFLDFLARSRVSVCVNFQFLQISEHLASRGTRLTDATLRRIADCSAIGDDDWQAWEASFAALGAAAGVQPEAVRAALDAAVRIDSTRADHGWAAAVLEIARGEWVVGEIVSRARAQAAAGEFENAAAYANALHDHPGPEAVAFLEGFIPRYHREARPFFGNRRLMDADLREALEAARGNVQPALVQ